MAISSESAPSAADSVPGTTGAPAPAPRRPPAVSLPKGGGAIKGIGEKFGANPVTGTGAAGLPERGVDVPTPVDGVWSALRSVGSRPPSSPPAISTPSAPNRAAVASG
ncbi:hypothetical protein ACFTUC_12465 [Streptomyces sp. NPDC056944]|uniref:hypothetical protein n=1 Tax=Streptomyces sp. NPDC056944 TaxID=3345972 RepID=UPI003639FC0A